MPCSDYTEHDRRESKAKIDNLTDLLCKAGKAFLAGEMPPDDVIQWWDAHEQADAARGEPWAMVEP